MEESLIFTQYSLDYIKGSWVITNDQVSYAKATPEQIAELKKLGYNKHFKMYDADDELYYEGYLHKDEENEFAPLDDFGMPNAGATDIHYRGEDGKYHVL